MARNNVQMIRLKRMFQLLAAGTPRRTICKRLKIGGGTLWKYEQAAQSQNLSFEDVCKLSDTDIEGLICTTKAPKEPSTQRKELDSLIPKYVAQLSRNRYMTVQRLHETYKQQYPDGYGYTQFKKAIRDYQYAHNLSYHNEYKPGELLQVDFAGDKLYVTDKKTQARTAVSVMVGVLPYSGYCFAKAMFTASMENFFTSLSDMFTLIGGTPSTVKSDNMKQWVKRYDRYEPTFSSSAVEWSAYYDVELETSRVRHPRDKGCVEGCVRKVYNAVYAVIREETHYTLAELNSRIQELVDEFNARPTSSTGTSRLELFTNEEQMCLGALPCQPYRYRHRKTVKVTSTYHIEVAKHKYSVPYQYVGRMVNVVWDSTTVEVYCGLDRIACHTMTDNMGYTTLDEHMPENHKAYQRNKEYNAAYFIERAEKIGPNTKTIISKMLSSTKHVQQSYNGCQGILRLQKAYGSERLEKACEKLSHLSIVSCRVVHNVLKSNLDQVPEEKAVTKTPENTEVRGAAAFNQIITLNLSTNEHTRDSVPT